MLLLDRIISLSPTRSLSSLGTSGMRLFFVMFYFRASRFSSVLLDCFFYPPLVVALILEISWSAQLEFHRVDDYAWKILTSSCCFSLAGSNYFSFLHSFYFDNFCCCWVRARQKIHIHINQKQIPHTQLSVYEIVAIHHMANICNLTLLLILTNWWRVICLLCSCGLWGDSRQDGDCHFYSGLVGDVCRFVNFSLCLLQACMSYWRRRKYAVLYLRFLNKSVAVIYGASTFRYLALCGPIRWRHFQYDFLFLFIAPSWLLALAHSSITSDKYICLMIEYLVTVEVKIKWTKRIARQPTAVWLSTTGSNDGVDFFLCFSNF